MEVKVIVLVDINNITSCGDSCDFWDEGVGDAPNVCQLFGSELYHGLRCDKCAYAETELESIKRELELANRLIAKKEAGQ